MSSCERTPSTPAFVYGETREPYIRHLTLRIRGVWSRAGHNHASCKQSRTSHHQFLLIKTVSDIVLAIKCIHMITPLNIIYKCRPLYTFLFRAIKLYSTLIDSFIELLIRFPATKSHFLFGEFADVRTYHLPWTYFWEEDKYNRPALTYQIHGSEWLWSRKIWARSSARMWSGL